MPEGNFFATFNDRLRARAESRRGARGGVQIEGVAYGPDALEPAAHGAPSAALRRPNTVSDYVGMVGRRWRLIAASASSFVTIAAAATWHMPTVYHAEAVVLLDTRNMQVSDGKAATPPRPLDPTTVRSELEVLKSPLLAAKVAEKLHLADRPDWAGMTGAQGGDDMRQRMQRIISSLVARLTAKNDGHSLVLKIDIAADHPQLAADIANAYADVYLEEQIAAKNEATRRSTEWMKTQVAALRDRLADDEQRISQYKDEHGIVAPRGTTVTAQELADINAQLVTAHSERVQKDAAVRYAKQVLASADGAEAAGEVLGSPLIQRLREQQADLVRRLAELSTRYKPAHPTMIRMAAEIDDLRRKIGEEANRVVRAMADEASAARTREETLRANLAELAQSTERQESAQIKLRELEREADSTRTLYEGLLARFNQTSSQEGALPDAQIIARAVPPATSSGQLKRRLLAGSTVLSMLFGLLLAVVVEQLDPSFRRADDVELAANLPVLGVVPAPERRRSEKRGREMGEAVLAEALRGIRRGLQQSLASMPLGVMLVTSSAEGEGKTFFAVTLGRSVVRARLRCLVIDCHFERPGLDRLLFPAPGPSVPTGRYPQIQVDKNSGLHYVPAPAPEQRRLFRAQDLFDSREMREYVQYMRGHYDLIILDAPPLAAIADVIALSRLADTAIFVLRWGRTQRRAAVDALRVLTLRGVSLAGIVLSHVNLRRYAAYGYGDYVRYLKDTASMVLDR